MKSLFSMPPSYFYLCTILPIAFYLIFPAMNMVSYPYNLTGLIFIAVGLYLIFMSHFLFKRCGTPENYDKSSCIVKENVYKASRNPMYLGALIFLFGVCILTGNVISLLSPLLFFLVMDMKFIPYEEKKMEDTFGDEFLEYKRQVRRWI